MTYLDAKIQKDYGKPTIGPSAIRARMGIAPDNDGVYDVEPGLEKGYSTPTAIENPEEIVEQFRQAAIYAKDAGFDGVELHGANGYLVSQVSQRVLTSPPSKRRKSSH
jgi:2,4-dienoyl-CoA reductase-like NADH-dependent reductase (Old Yellow Enzyme family)